ncbi:hypothetical protein EOD39_9565 [Acipenser ruthenus]|uniref:Uncharacterized protein n=1 Tax=Acipenser ruthenus TaxID=7906 RepID=A0A662YVA4_ACIRT|nr:hypothetical protein EOD39_9565 [Acipenser ruthenus]
MFGVKCEQQRLLGKRTVLNPPKEVVLVHLPNLNVNLDSVLLHMGSKLYKKYILNCLGTRPAGKSCIYTRELGFQ